MKKLISLCLALIMCMAVVPVSVIASADGEAVAAQTSGASDNTVTISYTDKKNFTNPVTNGADPFVFKDTDGTYYMYTTNAGGNGYIAYTSRDLVNWSSIDYVLKKGDVSVAGEETYTNFWAPEVFLYNGTYYMIVTVNERLVIATGPSPAGPFKTAENTSYLFEYQSIDGHFFQDDDGTVYLFYVKVARDSVFPYTSGNVIWGCEFDMETLTPIMSTNTRLVGAQYNTWEKESGYVAEGPEIFKRDGKYYMLYTCNGFKYAGYAVGAATATSPLGSYTKQSEPIMKGADQYGAVGTGHCCYTYSPDGSEMWMVYHKHAGLNQVENREICIDKITFDSNGKVHVASDFNDGKPTMTAQPYPSGSVSTVKDAQLDSNFAALVDLPTVYVHMNDGSDTATGTETDPYKTLERAYDALTPNGGTIVLVASHDLSNAQSNEVYLSPEPQIEITGGYFQTPDDITGPVMLRGRNPGIRLRFNYITFNSDHYIDNLILRPNAVTPIIECGFNNVTFGENLTVSPAYDSDSRGRYPILLGGYYQCGYGLADGDSYMEAYPYCLWKQDSRPYEFVSTDEDYTISVYGGTWRSIMGGSWRVRSDASLGLIDADVTLNLGGNCVVQPLCSNSADMNYLVNVTGYSALSQNATATLNITGGTYNCPVFVAGKTGTPAETEGVTHATVFHAGKHVANITGGTFISTEIGGTLRNAIISATADSAHNVTGDYELTVGKNATFIGTAAFYSTNGSAKVVGTKTAHICNEIFTRFTTSHFTTYDFYGNDGPVTIYLSQTGGSDKNDGLTPETAVANLGMTYKMMAPYGGTVIVTENKLASVDSYYSTPVCGGPVTIRGLTPDVQWQIDYFSISSDHIFDNITIYSRNVTTLIECKFNNVTFTETVTCAGGRNPFLMGGHYQGASSTSKPGKNFTPTVKSLDVVSTDKDYTLTVNGGTWRSIKGGNWRHAGGAHVGSIDGNVTVNIGKNAVVAPYNASGENYFVSPSGNNASNGGSFTMNISGTVNSPVFGSARLGSVSGTAASEYADFVADVSINLNGATIATFAEGTDYAKCYVSAKQDDTTAHDIDGSFIIHAYNTTIPATATVLGAAADNSHVYTDANFAATPVDFDFAGALNGRGNVIADGNGDGMLTNADITVMVRSISGFGSADVYNNDLDGNAKLNNRDVIALVQLLAGWDIEIVYYDYVDANLTVYNGEVSSHIVTNLPGEIALDSCIEGSGDKVSAGEYRNFLCDIGRMGVYDIVIMCMPDDDASLSLYRNREYLGSVTKTEGSTALVLRHVTFSVGSFALSIKCERGSADISYLGIREGGDAGIAVSDFSSTVTPLSSNGSWTTDGSALYANGYSKIIYGSESWGDYIFEADLTPTTDYKNAGMLVRASGMTVDSSKSDSALTNALQGYFIGFGTDKIVLGKFNYNWTGLVTYAMPLTTGRTYNFRVAVYGADISVWVDNSLVIEYTDPEPYLFGGVGFRTHSCSLAVDNMYVNDISDTGVRTFSNPTVLSYHDLGDPTVYYDDGKYYLMTTGRFDYYVSDDLVNFEYMGALTDKSALWGNKYYGGASIFKHDGTYYMFYTTYLSADSTETIMCVATSDNLTGPYTQKKQTKLDEEVCGSMSAGAFLFAAPDGQTYLYWYQTLTQYGNCIFGAKVSLSDGVVTIDRDSVKMLAYPTEDWEKKQENGVSGRVCERPNVYYHDGYYYLFYAGSHWKTSYGEGYAVSTSPLGDYTKYDSNPILSSTDELYGVGCTYILPSPDGSEAWVVYHCLNSQDKATPRKVCIDRLIFRDNGDGADIAVILGPTSGVQLCPQ